MTFFNISFEIDKKADFTCIFKIRQFFVENNWLKRGQVRIQRKFSKKYFFVSVGKMHALNVIIWHGMDFLSNSEGLLFGDRGGTVDTFCSFIDVGKNLIFFWLMLQTFKFCWQRYWVPFFFLWKSLQLTFGSVSNFFALYWSESLLLPALQIGNLCNIKWVPISRFVVYQYSSNWNATIDCATAWVILLALIFISTAVFLSSKIFDWGWFPFIKCY